MLPVHFSPSKIPHPFPSAPTLSPTHLLRLPNDLINRLSNILHIPRIRPRHTNPPVLRHVDMRILPHLQDLLLRQPREAEHADLLRDMLPAALLAVQLFEFAPQRLPHVDDAAAHRPQIGLPLLEQLGVVEDETRDPGPVRGRVADLAALEDRELRCDSANGVHRVRAGAGDEVEGAGSFAVEAEVLGEGLRDAQFEALLDEVADRPGVVLEVPGREALVGAVEEGEVLLGADDFGDVGPLGAGGVDAGGVVRAGVQEDDAAFGGGVDGRAHAVVVEAFGLRGEVGVGFDGQVDVGEDLVVVGPGRGGEVDGLVVGADVEFGEEETAEVDGAGAGDGLEGGDLEDVIRR